MINDDDFIEQAIFEINQEQAALNFSKNKLASRLAEVRKECPHSQTKMHIFMSHCGTWKYEKECLVCGIRMETDYVDFTKDDWINSESHESH